MIIAHMIGRKETNPYLEDVLARLSKLVDLVVFTDNGSKDNTPWVAMDSGAEVLQAMSPVDDKTLQEFAWDHLSEHASRGDWVLLVDPEEKPHFPKEFHLDQSEYEVLGAVVYHMWTPEKYRVDGWWVPKVKPKMFRFHRGAEFLESRPEPLYVRELIRQKKYKQHSGLVVQNFAYMADEDKMLLHNRHFEEGTGGSLKWTEEMLNPYPVLLDYPSI